MAKSAIEHPLDLDVRQRLDPSNQQWCHWLKEARESLGLSRMQLAQRMGYRKLQRGAARIAGWERGDDVPRSDRIPLLADKLGLNEKEVGSQAAREQEELSVLASNKTLLGRAESAAALFDIRLLGRYGELLLSRSAEVLDDVADAGLRVAGAMVVQAYIGGLCLNLDELLREWLAGRFQFRCGACGGIARCYYGGGSPLSGNHRLAAWCTGCEGRVTGRLPPDSPRENKLAQVLFGLKQRRGSVPSGRNTLVGRTLGQYLTQRFDLDVPDIHVTDIAGSVVALYRHVSGTLEGRGGEVLVQTSDLSSVSGDTGWRTSLQEQWGPSHERGTLVLGSLSPLRAGSWEGETLVLVDGWGSSWKASPGVLRDPSGRPVFRFDGPLPLAVLARLMTVGAAAAHTDDFSLDNHQCHNASSKKHCR